MADSVNGCLDVPPYPTGAGPGCILWSDGIHLHWSDPPTAPGQIFTWTGTDWVAANPPGGLTPVPVPAPGPAPAGKGGKGHGPL